jgi:pimeloyl-ACP methyl ester carboxylesterase
VGFLSIAQTPLAPGVSPARIHYREAGRGSPIVILHGGWGYDMYPFDRQIAALAPQHRLIIPDRTGYGRSPSIDALPPDFHRRAADETRAVVDALGLERPALWGHSDGAIIALRLALAIPDRVSAIIAEASHYFRRKPRSRRFFGSVIANPASTEIMRLHARAWLQIGDDAASDTEDFYDGRLSEIAVPVLIVHGAQDPRTEPGEIEALGAAVGAELAETRDGGETAGGASSAPARLAMLAAAGHSPHSENATADAVTRLAAQLIDARA